MNDIINKFLLAGDKFMPEMHLKQPQYTYNAFRPFTKSKERIQKFKETGDSRYIYRNQLDKGLASMVYKFFDRNTVGSGVESTPQNEQLADELHKPIVKKFKKRKVYSAFKDNIWAADLADIQLISRFNKEFRFLSSVIDIFSKYAWIVLLKYKKGISIVNAVQRILKK